MIVDRQHRNWIIATLVLLAAAVVCYVLYVRADGEPRGGTWQGLLFGIVGSGLMLYAGLFGMRKKFPRWRIGTAQVWLRGHIWLGLLSVPMILFHSAFRLGGALELALMVIFGLVILSGVVGLLLQQFLPHQMTQSLPGQAMYDQIPVVCRRLEGSAEMKVVAVCGPLWTETAGDPPGSSSGRDASPEQRFRTFYLEHVRPFLQPRPGAAREFAKSTRTLAVFSEMEQSLPGRFHEALSEVKAICDERRMLLAQQNYQLWLHGWLLLHVPLSMALLIFGVLHAVMSLYY
jgi:hypothetical protein